MLKYKIEIIRTSLCYKIKCTHLKSLETFERGKESVKIGFLNLFDKGRW